MPDRSRLWIISEVYYPEMISTGYYLTTTAESLADDREVKVICGQPNYASRGTVAPKHETRNRVEIFRVPSTRMDKNRILGRVVNMITLGMSMTWACVRRFRRGDSVMVVTAPPSLPFSTALAALIRGASYTLLLHDAYPEQLVAVGSMRADSLPVRALDLFNRWLYKHAAKIIVVGRDMVELMEKKTRGLDIPIVNIPNWADLDLVRPAPRDGNPVLASLGLESKFVILSAGNIGRPLDLETVVECADLMRQNEEVQFVFIGGGARLPWLREQVTSRGLTNITLAGSMPREDQSVFLNACDVGLITLVKGMWGAAVPSRTYNFLAAGKPILALLDQGSETCRIIEEENVGWAVTSPDPLVLKQTIEQILENKNELPAMSDRARAAALAKHSPEVAMAAYREALD